ncbi:MAG: histidine kinase [Lewinellaceae bacterium]|nr:histidine kinase [Lewinellaceae bacterium]
MVIFAAMKPWTETILHLAFWLFCLWILYTAFAFESVEIVVENGMEREMYVRASGVLPSMVIVLAGKALFFYGAAFYVLPEYFAKRKWQRLLYSLGALLLACQLVEWGAHHLLFGIKVLIPVGMDVLFSLLFLFAAFAYRLSKDWWNNERQRALLAEEKLAAELNYLKAQLNPHFLFNTLNNLYALAEREGNAPLSDGIASLAELMRYAVYDSRADYVPLTKELRFIQSMVEMQSLSLEESDDVDIALQFSGEMKRLKIAPLLLVPFVENAFKHGIRYGRHSVINIKAEVEGRQLRFLATNTIQEQGRPHEERTGVGLENARRRLELLYPGRHQLDIGRNGDIFSVNLQISLNEEDAASGGQD